MEENTQQPAQRKGMPMGVIVVVLIAILAVAGFVYASNNKTQDATKEQHATNTSNTNPQTSPADTQANATSTYKDGTYTAVGEYQSPGGAESLDVALTLKDGVITDSNVVSNAERPISVKMQGQFISGYKSEVIGKNIDEVKLDVVSGSSLSPKGFNDAVEKIKQQAQA